MSSIPTDLIAMILERTPCEDLKSASRVGKEWRFYAANNLRRMRTKKAKSIQIDCTTGLIQVEIERSGIMYRPPPHAFRNVTDLLKYSSGMLYLNSPTSNNEVKKLLEEVPKWWISQITALICHIFDDDFIISFISKFPRLLELSVGMYNDKNLLPLIEKSSSVEVFVIWERGNFIIDDSVLEALITKSRKFPTNYPALAGKVHITLAQLINFLENNNFSEKNFQVVAMQNPVKGKEVDWKEWLLRNTEKEGEYDHRFRYRGKRFFTRNLHFTDSFE